MTMHPAARATWGYALSPRLRSLGRRLRERRLALGLSIKRLAAQLGLSWHQPQRWETGENLPSLEALERLCGALGVTPNWLMGCDEVGE